MRLNKADMNSTEEQNAELKEPSLGPACLVVTIVGLALGSAFCAFGSFILLNDQYPSASKAINKQLIPWVQESNLEEPDKQSIVQQLRDLLPQLEARTITKEQLLRLRNALQDNPVLLWGNIQSIQRQAAESGLTDLEKEVLNLTAERLLRMAAERELSRRDLEFTFQDFSKVRSEEAGAQVSGIEVNGDLTDEQLREFMKRAQGLLEQAGQANEGYEKTAAQAFQILINSALDVSPPK